MNAGEPMRGSDDDVSSEDLTPPAGIEGLIGADGVIGADGLQEGSPAVLGGDHLVGEQQDEARDWPKLEYRSRSRRGGAFDWIRGDRDNQ